MKFCPLCGQEGQGPTCPTDGVTLIERTQPVSLEGTTLKGMYRVDRKIGEGGFGVVYEGTQLALGRRVAIKTLLPGLERDPSLVTRFFREARVLSQLNHPNVVLVYDAGNTEGGVFFLVMELLEGAPLNELVGAGRGLPLATALQVFKHICAGVGEAHRAGLIHRDLKPANVFLEKRAGRGMNVKVLDFGLARHVTMDTHITRDGFMLGTPGYAAPEQITASSEPDARSDIYGLAAIFYFMLAGRDPFGGTTAQSIMARQLSAGPEPLPAGPESAPGPLQDVIFRALATDPRQRFQSVAELWQALTQAAASAPPPGRTAVLPTGLPSTGPGLPPRGAGVPATTVLPSGTGAPARTATGTTVLPTGSAPAQPLPALPPTSLLPTPSFTAGGSGTSGVAPPGLEIQPRSGILLTGVEVPLSIAGPGPSRRPVWSARRKLLLGGGAGALAAVGFGIGVKLGIARRKPVRLGMSAAFSGPSQYLGRAMHTGLQARLFAAEAAAELPFPLQLLALDDGYEPTRTQQNMGKLLDGAKVLAVVGNVGTPTAAAALPLCLERRTPLVGALSGAPVLRKTPPDRYVFNYRASYAQETAAMIDHFVGVRRIAPEKIAVFAQADSFGDAGMAGVVHQLRKHEFADSDRLLRVGYERNSLDVSQAIEVIAARGREIEAVVMIATYQAAARFIDGLRHKQQEKLYGNVSFVGSEALAEELRGLGPAPKEAIVTQVVPHPLAEATGVIKYRETLARFFPEETPSFVSLEGYIVGCLMVEALARCQAFEREELVDVLEGIKQLDLGIGTSIDFGPSDHEGGDKVWGTTIASDFSYQSLDLVG